jgi:hypothetical protein
MERQPRGLLDSAGMKRLENRLSAPVTASRTPKVGASPEVQRATSPLATVAAQAPAPLTITNDIKINANGLSEDAAKAVITRELEKSQRGLLQQAGRNSLRRNLE